MSDVPISVGKRLEEIRERAETGRSRTEDAALYEAILREAAQQETSEPKREPTMIERLEARDKARWQQQAQDKALDTDPNLDDRW